MGRICTFSERLRIGLEISGMKAAELSRQTGIDKSSISHYLKGDWEGKQDAVYLIASALGVSEAWLMGYDTPMERNAFKKETPPFPSPNITEDYTTFPVIGEIAAGYDSIAIEEWEGDVIDIPNVYLRGRSKSDFFVLRVKGDSMYPTYHDGDKVLILKQTTLGFSGQVGAILYEDENATLKKVEFVPGEDWLRLVPINANYPPKRIEGEELEHCRVIGIPRLLIREIED